ncbi:tetratricopeptide repeat-containing sulfotransferase family protein [Sphingomonas oryzagri]|uniref:Sulfotransferase n=1 Tax=Sphingomonas oryzagri TaxID=3042314 RepID=A0ABT6N1E8_9SPHN|nr:tetratricopeptide repeat-containing sulfotransferase family protein [Sphingomonas oryzagri]MDH7639119.1 sulfotransferase [Sphingomonas oryzagri]
MPDLNPIEALIAARRLDEARVVWRACFVQGAADVSGWFALGRMGARLGIAEASACFERAADGHDNPAPLIHLAHHRLMTGDSIGALKAARDAVERSPRDVPGLLQLGSVFAHCDAGEEALALFEQAAALAPGDPSVLYNLATAQRTNGRIDEAERSIDAVILLRPDDGEAHYLRAGLRRQTEARNHVGELQAALARHGGRATPADVPLHFALGKELEDIGRFEEAFHHFEAGGRLRRTTFRYDVAGDVATMEALAAQHDTASLDLRSGEDADAPIFIVGLPRSGTTLVERILAAHPDVTAGGELDAFPRAAVATTGPVSSKEEFVARSLAVPPGTLARAYGDHVGARAGRTPRFTDKLPINGLYVGLIARSLPGARIVLVTRDPMANGFAMFSTLFAQAYPFSYDLGELGRYMVAWHGLMAHWQETLGPRMLTLRYEDLVADPEANTRKLLDYCGLAWDPACLAFHESEGSVSSASAVQVRQPIHRNSVEKWRRYGAALDPLAKALGTLAD